MVLFVVNCLFLDGLVKMCMSIFNKYIYAEKCINKTRSKNVLLLVLFIW